MSDQTPQIKLIQSQRGKAVARTEQIIDELATFRSISGDYGSFWSDSKITVSAVAISVGSGQEIAKFSGIRLHSNRFSDYFRFCESYFDFDEIDDFLRGIEFVKSSMARMQEPSAESKQVYYSSNDDVHIGFYQPERDEQQTTYLCIDGANGEMFRFRNDEPAEEADGEGAEPTVSEELSLPLNPSQDYDQIIAAFRKGQELLSKWKHCSV